MENLNINKAIEAAWLSLPIRSTSSSMMKGAIISKDDVRLAVATFLRVVEASRGMQEVSGPSESWAVMDWRHMADQLANELEGKP